MSTTIDMMPSEVDPSLARRLEQLTGQDAACCAEDLQGEAAAIRGAKRFDTALAQAKALADENRLLACLLLKQRAGRGGDPSMCACEIQAALGLTHATVSHHMRALLDAGAVVSERRGKWVHYALAPGIAQRLPDVNP